MMSSSFLLTLNKHQQKMNEHKDTRLKSSQQVDDFRNAERNISFSSASIQASFPEILMSILDNEDAYGHLIAWHPDGKAFLIRHPKRFAEEVLPIFFRRGCKFNSFMRKLYFWGFKKVRKTGFGTVATFHHEQFYRGSIPLCMHARVIERVQRDSCLKRKNNNKFCVNETSQNKEKSKGSISTSKSNELPLQPAEDVKIPYDISTSATCVPEILKKYEETNLGKPDNLTKNTSLSVHNMIDVAPSGAATSPTCQTPPLLLSLLAMKYAAAKPLKAHLFPQQERHQMSPQYAGLIDPALPLVLLQHQLASQSNVGAYFPHVPLPLSSELSYRMP